MDVLADNHLRDLGAVTSLNALRSPDRIAVADATGVRRTHAELDRRTNQLAQALLGLGLTAGDRIGAWMDDVVEYVEVYVAAAKAGLVVVPVNHRLTVAEAGFQLEHTGARALIYTADVGDRAERLVKELSLMAVVARGTPTMAGHGWDEILDAASTAPLPPPDPDTAFMICFTSGTSGRPKGAVLTHRSVMTLATTQLTALRIPIGGVNLQIVSMSFAATVCSQMVPHLLAGGTQVLYQGSWDSDRVLDLVAKERATHIYVPGPAVLDLAASMERDPSRWRTLNSVLHAGSKADPEDLRRLADVVGSRFVEGWGMTEISGGLATALAPNDLVDPDPAVFTTVGRPVPGTMVRAVDEQDNTLPAGEVGELVVRSASVFAGYWADPDVNAAVLRNGWYYTGDIGSVDARGYVSISDRRTNLIVSGGMNIYPAEIELALSRCPGVVECAVVGGPHPRWGQTPVAVVVRDPAANLDEDAVVAFLKTRLASYKKPTRVIWVDEIPRTTGGKVARGRLRSDLGLDRGVE